MVGISSKRAQQSVCDVSEPPDNPAVKQIVTVYSRAGAARHANYQILTDKRERLLQRTPTPQQKLLQTLDLLNEAQAINTLPNELLTHVLEISQPTTDALDAANWLGRLYVCRRWYHLITSMPRFWRDIYVSSHPEWLELSLSRCASMQADVFITGRFSLVSTVPIMKEHAHAIRGIAYTVRRSSWVSDIAKLLSIRLPSLQTLDISLSTKSPRYADITWQPENIRHLKTLRLRSCLVPHHPAMYSDLSTLDIGHCLWKITFECLMTALGSARNLSELVLHDCFTKWSKVPGGFARQSPSPRTPIVLSRLRVLKLTAIPAQLASHFLAHMRVPNANHIHIHVVKTNTRGVEQVSSIWDVFPVNAAAFNLTCSLATSLCLETHTLDFSITAKSESRYLHVRVPRGPGSGYVREINGLVDAFGGAPVSDLDISMTSGGVLSSVWERVLRTYPTLREIHSYIGGAFFSALKAVSQPAGGAICCPDLASLTSSSPWRMSERTHGIILDTLRMRSAVGVQLESLKLRLTFTDKDGAKSNEHRKFERELKALVKEPHCIHHGYYCW